LREAILQRHLHHRVAALDYTFFRYATEVVGWWSTFLMISLFLGFTIVYSLLLRINWFYYCDQNMYVFDILKIILNTFATYTVVKP